MSSLPVTPEIPPLETYPVTGEPGAITVQSGHLLDGSQLMATQGQQVSGIASSLAPTWTGEAGGNYQTFSGVVSSAFARAATELEGAALLLARYASALETFQQQARAADAQSQHWHEQIATWTARLNAAKTAVTTAQGQLDAAQRAYATASASGPSGAAAAGAASAAAATAQAALTTAQRDVTTATRALADAHHQFTIWQQRARHIHAEAHRAGEALTSGLLAVTIVAPPLPGTPDYPALEPTPRILLNDEGGEGKDGAGDEGDGAKGAGDKGGTQPDYPTELRAWKDKDGKWHVSGPDPGETTATQGDPGEQHRKDERFLQGLRDGTPKEPPSVLIGRLLTGA
jgi:hypothetical protein